VALVVGAIAIATSVSLDVLTGGGPVDWATYTNGADRFVAGLPLYSTVQLSGPYQLKDIVASGYLYPPPSVLLFLAHGPFVSGYIAWMVVNVGVLIAGLAAALRREFGSAVPWPLALTCLALAAFPPFHFGAAIGNVSIGLAGIYAWAWASEGKGWLGPIAGALAVLKVYPGLLALWCVRQGSWRPVAIAMGVAAAILVATVPILGLDMWGDFVTSTLNARPTCTYAVPSIPCLVAPLPEPVARVVPILLSALLALASLRTRDRLIAYGCLGLATLVPLTDWTDYYLVIPFVFLAVALAHALGSRRCRGAETSLDERQRAIDAVAAEATD
jgi:hypothetical protein